jgi:hypothetical protein
MNETVFLYRLTGNTGVFRREVISFYKHAQLSANLQQGVWCSTALKSLRNLGVIGVVYRQLCIYNIEYLDSAVGL